MRLLHQRASVSTVAAVATWVRSAYRTGFWQSKEHELDFVLSPSEFLEVKHGRTSPVEFAWFSKVFPKAHLTVISQTRYDTANLTGIGLEEFLRQEG